MFPTTKTVELAESLGFLQKRRTGYGKISKTTLVDIQDWLRDNHNIHCSVAPWRDGYGKVYKIHFEANVIDVNNNWRTDIVKSFFKDYYKCLEACIAYSLQILKDRYGKEK